MSQFLKHSIAVFKQYKTLSESAINQLNDEELYIMPDSESNSVAIIVRHMAGNMISRWTDIFNTDGEKPNRNRDTEFEQEITPIDLNNLREKGWYILFQTLESLNEDDLSKTIYIRNEPHTVMQAIIRQIAHYSYHVGQIVYIAKLIKKDEWKNLSIAKNKSQEYNQSKMN